MNVQLVHMPHVDEVWHVIKGGILRSIEAGNAFDITLSDIYRGVRGGGLFLFVSDDLKAAAIVGFERHVDCEAARIVAMYSDKPDDWGEVVRVVEAFGKANGASKVVFDGRKGWARAIPQAKVVQYRYEVQL